jgi:hypothetical protein
MLARVLSDGGMGAKPESMGVVKTGLINTRSRNYQEPPTFVQVRGSIKWGE